MSEENVEIARAVIRAWNSGDMDAFRELYDPQVVIHAPQGWPEPGPFVGRDAVMRQYQRQREVWDADKLEAVSDFIEDRNRVMVRFVWHASGQGPEGGFELTALQTMRKGKIVGTEFFWDHAEALEAAGLSE